MEYGERNRLRLALEFPPVKFKLTKYLRNRTLSRVYAVVGKRAGLKIPPFTFDPTKLSVKTAAAQLFLLFYLYFPFQTKLENDTILN
ncbi:hypothetical protein D4L85_05030 [Chryseolinea soli]|uniref:Uncharacterized protein n=1 Tax=Chryseolinea soli TaxID=2321403 RepID=A0A385SHP9_9BACT|nr:hypothetical protein D4L85_05030 [Chryseolinea soli]